MECKAALIVGVAPQLKAMLFDVLRAPDWSVREAPDNAAALEAVRSNAFDLILTSVKTSGQEDLELLRRIRQVHPHTRVIILTDQRTPDDVLAAIREGAFSYFSSPFSVSALEDMVRNAMEGAAWEDGIKVISNAPNWVRLAARCDAKTADRLLQFAQEIFDLPEDEREPVATALRELLMNAIEHGGKFDPEKYVELSYVRTKRAVACRLKDPGEGFSLDEIVHAAVANPPEDPLRHVGHREAANLRPGGFGVLLARNSVDELMYTEQGNEVLLIKYLDKCPDA